MELQEMKRQWENMSTELSQQKIINKELIMEMTKTRFKNKINTIGKYEGIGTLICIPAGIFILFNIHKMDSLILLASAIFCIGALTLVPLISFRLISQMKQSVIQSNNYKESIINFAKSRRRFLLLQKLGGVYGLLLMLAITPVFNRITGDEPFEFSPYFWIGAAVFVLIFSRWGYRKYEGMTGNAEEMLRSLEDGE